MASIGLLTVSDLPHRIVCIERKALGAASQTANSPATAGATGIQIDSLHSKTRARSAEEQVDGTALRPVFCQAMYNTAWSASGGVEYVEYVTTWSGVAATTARWAYAYPSCPTCRTQGTYAHHCGTTVQSIVESTKKRWCSKG
jgi:hypothetical protein